MVTTASNPSRPPKTHEDASYMGHATWSLSMRPVPRAVLRAVAHTCRVGLVGAQLSQLSRAPSRAPGHRLFDPDTGRWPHGSSGPVHEVCLAIACISGLEVCVCGRWSRQQGRLQQDKGVLATRLLLCVVRSAEVLLLQFLRVSVLYVSCAGLCDTRKTLHRERKASYGGMKSFSV